MGDAWPLRKGTYCYVEEKARGWAKDGQLFVGQRFGQYYVLRVSCNEWGFRTSLFHFLAHFPLLVCFLTSRSFFNGVRLTELFFGSKGLLFC